MKQTQEMRARSAGQQKSVGGTAAPQRPDQGKPVERVRLNRLPHP